MTEREEFLHTLKRAMELTPEVFEVRSGYWAWTHKPSGLRVYRVLGRIKLDHYNANEWKLSLSESLPFLLPMWRMKRRLKRQRKSDKGLPEQYRGRLKGLNQRTEELPF